MAVEWMSLPAIAASVRELAAGGTRRLLVTSTVAGEGKSSVITDLAFSLAESGTESVVAVDADVTRPGLHESFGVRPERGMRELLDRLYLFDITREDPVQFGLGDWVEILRAQMRSGELHVTEDKAAFTIHFVKGAIRSISEDGVGEETSLGGLLIRSGAISSGERDDFLRIQQQSGRPFGEVARTLGSVGEGALTAALQEQATRRLTKLTALRRPKCEFAEVAEAYRAATGGRTLAAGDGPGVDEFVDARFGEYLKDPFFASQLPVFLTDTPLPNLKLLASGERPLDLMSPRIGRAFGLMLARLARIFDVVLLDGPPVSASSPALALATRVDGVVLVVKADGPEVASVRHAVEDLRRAGANVVGVVLNQAEPGSAGEE